MTTRGHGIFRDDGYTLYFNYGGGYITIFVKTQNCAPTKG